MIKINWNEAPEGAQRYNAALSCPWLRKDSGKDGVVYWWFSRLNAWVAHGDNAEGLHVFNEATPRPMTKSIDTCPDCGETGGHTERCNDANMPLFNTEQGEEIERLKAELDKTMREASLLATAMHNDFYNKASPNFELCDSPAGVLTQIDNMYAGIRETLRNAENDRLRAETNASYLLQKLGDEDEAVWFWQGDGDDHLESLANGTAVVIRADDLRSELANKGDN